MDIQCTHTYMYMSEVYKQLNLDHGGETDDTLLLVHCSGTIMAMTLLRCSPLSLPTYLLYGYSLHEGIPHIHISTCWQI